MPLPTPNSGESRDDFIARCMEQIAEGESEEQQLAICFSQWRGKENMLSQIDVGNHQVMGGRPLPIAIRNEQILIHADIGETFWGDGMTSDTFKNALRDIDGPVTVDINTQGGDVFHGMAIRDALIQHPYDVTVHISGIAASAGAIICTGGDRVTCSDGATHFVHRAQMGVWGDVDDLAFAMDLANQLDKNISMVLAKQSGKTPEEMMALMTANNGRGTTLVGEEIVNAGFADDMITRSEAKAEPMPQEVQNRLLAFARARADAIAREVIPA